jgi:glycosyltransferase involved in cell wall biosynthesis
MTGDAAPRVSVIVPCHDLGRWLPETVDSVLAQTYTSWELLVVDDGSTDAETVRLLDDPPWPRARVLRTACRGLAAARNLLIERSRGELLCALDADDLLHPTFLEKAVAAIDEDPGLTFVSCWVQLFGEESWTWRQEACDLVTLLGENTVATPALVRRQAVVDVGGYDEGMPHMGEEDWELWLRLVAAGHRGTILPEVLFSYRRRQGSMFTRCTSGAVRLELVRYVVRKHLDLYRRHAPEVLLAKEREIGPFLRENSRLQMELGERSRRLAARRSELERLESRVARASARDAELSALHASLQAARAESKALRASASWRVTAPLRFVHALLSGPARRSR